MLILLELNIKLRNILKYNVNYHSFSLAAIGGDDAEDHCIYLLPGEYCP